MKIEDGRSKIAEGVQIWKQARSPLSSIFNNYLNPSCYLVILGVGIMVFLHTKLVFTLK